MVAAADLTGIRFGKLVAVERVASSSGHARWRFACDCGRSHEATATNVKCGYVTHCGCSPATLTHGLHKSRLYRVWSAMRQRCSNANNDQYANYGGRGIVVCPEWESFQTFAAWAGTAGYADNLEIDRREVNGPYSPANCRFVTSSVNKRNMRTTTFVEYQGERIALADLADRVGISVRTLRGRLNKQRMTVEQAVSIPRDTWRTRRLQLQR